MPERVFKYNSVPELFALAKELSTSLTSDIQELQGNSTGFKVRTGGQTVGDKRQMMAEVRYEIFLRGRGFPNQGVEADDLCAQAEPTDPRLERVMRVETCRY